MSITLSLVLFSGCSGSIKGTWYGTSSNKVYEVSITDDSFTLYSPSGHRVSGGEIEADGQGYIFTAEDGVEDTAILSSDKKRLLFNSGEILYKSKEDAFDAFD
jgi:hypothetical protein